jgi:hypothetical protein
MSYDEMLDKLNRLALDARIWLFAPPLHEAQRRAKLLRELIEDNPE